MRVLSVLFLFVGIYLHADIRFSGMDFSAKNHLHILRLDNPANLPKFMPPSKIRENHSKAFNFDYELCKKLYVLKKQKLENRLAYISRLDETTANQYAESLTGENNSSTLKKLILDIKVEIVEIDKQLKQLELYKKKYIISPKAHLKIIYRRD
ncbi:hypothetical protein PQO01_07200 [Lentisphaera marina]|uniref:hypothetical protein n=1 Tax=Lentisphaera marina TaxID=1111041 RepID=UPI0023660B5E|nr:hypothetical protein [Lentisphaera marina]MDD7984734.1 hypothetical protein [Lentisphaera marina]